ncbi:hypothetical protein [Citrobacter koseri]|uniref:hypothetical protein n=1 Tax=Citrobacter koseri TaxID=545 RepID=UPI0038924BEB
MNKDPRKESNRIFLHLAEQCFDMEFASISNGTVDEVKKLNNDEEFIMEIYTKCFNTAKYMFPKVARYESSDGKLSLKLVDKDYIFKKLREYQHKAK